MKDPNNPNNSSKGKSEEQEQDQYQKQHQHQYQYQHQEQIQINSIYKIPLYLDMDDVILNSSEVVISILNKRFNINPPKSITDLKDWGYRSIYRNLTIKDIEDIYESEEFWEQVQIREEALYFLFNPAICYQYHIFFVTKGTKKNIEHKERLLKKVFERILCSEYHVFTQQTETEYTNDKDSLFRGNFIAFMHKEKSNICTRYVSPRYQIVSTHADTAKDTDKFLSSKEQGFSYTLIGLSSACKEGKKEVDMSNGIQVDDNANYLNTNAKLKIILKNNIETNYNQVPINDENYHSSTYYTAQTFKDMLDILKFLW